MSMHSEGNVLLTCGGKWVGMVLSLKQAMKKVPAVREGKIIVGDRADLTPAGCFADGAVVLPGIHDPGYINSLIDVCRKHTIRVLVPIIDLDLVRISPHRERFAEIGTTAVCPPPELVELCFDKRKFMEFAHHEGLPCPQSYSAEELDVAPYPLFVKQRRGFGSIGAGKCFSATDARALYRESRDLIFQEFIEAPEISVDAFISATGKCTFRVQRVRDKVLGGEAWQSHTIMSLPVRELASRTADALSKMGLRGPLNIQIFATEPPILIEVNTRLGSASVFSNFATDGRLFAAVLNEACGGISNDDPDNYLLDIRLYRFFGEVYHDGKTPKAIFPF
jgi:carbamoyl-phosphate synthase large subunit